MSQTPEYKVTQEREAVAGRTIVMFAIAMASVSALAVLLSTRLQEPDGARATSRPGRAPPERSAHVIGAVEQTLIEHQADGLDARRRAELDLHRYAWVDRAHGLVRIPIDRAMDLYVEQHRDDGGTRP